MSKVLIKVGLISGFLALVGGIGYVALNRSKSATPADTGFAEKVENRFERELTDAAPTKKEQKKKSFSRKADKYTLGQDVEVAKVDEKPINVASLKKGEVVVQSKQEAQVSEQRPALAVKKKTASQEQSIADKPFDQLTDKDKKKIEEASARIQNAMMKEMSDEEKAQFVEAQQKMVEMMQSEEFQQQVREVEERMAQDPKFKEEVENFNKQLLGSIMDADKELAQ